MHREDIMNQTQENQQPTQETSKTKAFIKELLSWVKVFVVAAVLAYAINNYVLINANVPTGSMENTIPAETRMFGLRLAYTFDEPERGDIIIFKFPDDETQNYVKRIIGMPGDTVDIIDGKIYINESETPLDEPYLKEEWVIENGSDGSPLHFEVPEGKYFMLGDNRNESEDSRYWNNPYVAKEKILAKAIFSYWPLSHASILK